MEATVYMIAAGVFVIAGNTDTNALSQALCYLTSMVWAGLAIFTQIVKLLQ